MTGLTPEKIAFFFAGVLLVGTIKAFDKWSLKHRKYAGRLKNPRIVGEVKAGVIYDSI